MHKLKKMERYLRVNLFGPGPRLMKKEFTGAGVSQRLRNTALDHCGVPSAAVSTVCTEHSSSYCLKTR